MDTTQSSSDYNCEYKGDMQCRQFNGNNLSNLEGGKNENNKARGSARHNFELWKIKKKLFCCSFFGFGQSAHLGAD